MEHGLAIKHPPKCHQLKALFLGYWLMGWFHLWANPFMRHTGWPIRRWGQDEGSTSLGSITIKNVSCCWTLIYSFCASSLVQGEELCPLPWSLHYGIVSSHWAGPLKPILTSSLSFGCFILWASDFNKHLIIKGRWPSLALVLTVSSFFPTSLHFIFSACQFFWMAAVHGVSFD